MCLLKMEIVTQAPANGIRLYLERLLANSLDRLWLITKAALIIGAGNVFSNCNISKNPNYKLATKLHLIFLVR